MELIKLRNGFSQCNDVRFSTTSGAILFVVEILFYFTLSSFAPLFPPTFSREKNPPKNFLLDSHKDHFCLICVISVVLGKQSALVLNLNTEPSLGPFVVSI